MRYAAAAKTDVGRKRQGNEDSFCLAPDLGLFVVADGMGGHAAGEVASRLAVDTIREWMVKYLAGEPVAVVGPEEAGCTAETNYLLSSIRLANRIIFDAAQGRADYQGMGTTLVSILARESGLTLAHVGDSRIYLIRGENIEQLSRDHSFVQQQVDRGIITPEAAAESQYRHMITRALGLKETVEIDAVERPAEAADTLLLCSDGLSDLLEDEEILGSVREDDNLEAACQRLIDRANRKGGDDNITVLLLRAEAGASPARPGRPRPAAGQKRRGWFWRLFGG
jgi:serine/threonine protein phosphatase PrpC